METIRSLEQRKNEKGKGEKLLDGHTHRQTDNLKNVLEFWIQNLLCMTEEMNSWNCSLFSPCSPLASSPWPATWSPAASRTSIRRWPGRLTDDLDDDHCYSGDDCRSDEDCQTDDHDGECCHSDDCDDGHPGKEKHSGEHFMIRLFLSSLYFCSWY